jgi:hypothetical protein
MGTKGIAGFALACVLAAAAPAAGAGVLCRKKSGVMFLRDTACRKKETPVDVGTLLGPLPARVGAVEASVSTLAATVGGLAASVNNPVRSCPPDAVRVGESCVDKYEASVWQIAVGNTALIAKVQQGTVTLADLEAGGAVQLGCPSAPWNATAYPPNFPAGGQWTPVVGSDPPSPGVYAVSIPGVRPSTCIDWFRAAQACALSAKRLATNREWQDAAAGTPDPGGADDGATTCVTNSPIPANTGARSACVSKWGAFDMIGNVWEWVTDWADKAQGCPDWTSQTGLAGADLSCFGGPGDSGGTASRSIPGALIRGWDWSGGTNAGVFAVDGGGWPSTPDVNMGFRCAR